MTKNWKKFTAEKKIKFLFGSKTTICLSVGSETLPYNTSIYSTHNIQVKLWHTATGFCFITFTEHESGVTGLAFTPNGKVVLSASLDGTVRAFDMARYRNFKTLTTPRPVQLSCLSVDSAGDLIVAGGQDVFEIYLWSLTTGRLLEILAGHEGPVSALAFSPSPTSSQLASVSWDKTLRVGVSFFILLIFCLVKTYVYILLPRQGRLWLIIFSGSRPKSDFVNVLQLWSWC
jgi:WD40 repeat protein